MRIDAKRLGEGLADIVKAEIAKAISAYRTEEQGRMKYSEIKMLAEEFGPVVRSLINEATAPLTAQIKALETEIRHGHERLKQLEGNHD